MHFAFQKERSLIVLIVTALCGPNLRTEEQDCLTNLLRPRSIGRHGVFSAEWGEDTVANAAGIYLEGRP